MGRQPGRYDVIINNNDCRLHPGSRLIYNGFMSKTKPAAKISVTEILSTLAPGQLAGAFESVEQFIARQASHPTEQIAELIGGLKGVLSTGDEKAKAALHALLCEEKSDLREMAEQALGSGAKTAVALLVPALIAQFALAPAIAIAVATLAVKALASKSREKLCASLAEYANPDKKPARARKTTAPRAKPNTAKTSTTKKPASKPKAVKNKVAEGAKSAKSAAKPKAAKAKPAKEAKPAKRAAKPKAAKPEPVKSTSPKATSKKPPSGSAVTRQPEAGRAGASKTKTPAKKTKPKAAKP